MKTLLIALLLFSLALSGCAPAPAEAAPAGFVDTGVDPEAWALVPAGEFLQGLHEHETLIDAGYEIMVTDVTREQFTRYLNEALAAGAIKMNAEGVVGYYPGDEFHAYEHEEEIKAGEWLHLPLTDPALPLSYDGASFSAPVEYANHPMTMVTWFGAKAYCEYYGWRLPSELEWEKAARGEDNRPFPWGFEIQTENANYYSSYDIFEKTFGKAGGTTPVGFYNGGVYTGYQTVDSPSPYGLYDMAGDVWQWTGDVYAKQHYRYMRGGSFQNYAYNLRVWTRNNAGPTFYSPAVGFRCAR
ncbi:MAG: SUMF1/EgtB/PvdO family nonheme iron enzyme [Anaerolineales bacterium]|nr:SUMF1/EgtB/PvdO family nonheme iron enzyme [Anaerolineales bacterium]